MITPLLITFSGRGYIRWKQLQRVKSVINWVSVKAELFHCINFKSCRHCWGGLHKKQQIRCWNHFDQMSQSNYQTHRHKSNKTGCSNGCRCNMDMFFLCLSSSSLLTGKGSRDTCEKEGWSSCEVCLAIW